MFFFKVNVLSVTLYVFFFFMIILSDILIKQLSIDVFFFSIIILSNILIKH
jgi:hypothetical protein